MKTNFEDVQDFHNRFGLDANRPSVPCILQPDLARFRIGFLIEELAEYTRAQGAIALSDKLFLLAIEARTAGIAPLECDLLGAADALVDLSVVTLGTADFHGIPWQECWDEVHRANMSKRRAALDGSDSKRASGFDIVKPDGWKAPDHSKILVRT